jgi:hypothetical protein
MTFPVAVKRETVDPGQEGVAGKSTSNEKVRTGFIHEVQIQ